MEFSPGQVKRINLILLIICTKLFMHVSSRNMFPTFRNLQIRVHVYRPRHCCGDWLTFGCFFPMIADPPYSKLNFQGYIFFTQNWCNITLSIFYLPNTLHRKLWSDTSFPNWWSLLPKIQLFLSMFSNILKTPKALPLSI
jgi:hypothetical protein